MDLTAISGLSVLFAGVVGVLAAVIMGIFVLAFKHYQVIPVNGIRAIGRSFTSSHDRALTIGWEIHLVMGFLFGTLYRLLLALFTVTNPVLVVSSCIGFGIAHGLVVSFLVVIDVGEYSEAERYREQGIQLASIYWAAHVIFGLVVGLAFVALGIAG